MDPKLRLIYFDSWGRAELPRYILAVGGIDYEDIRLNLKEFEEYRTSKNQKLFRLTACRTAALCHFLEAPFSLVPVLECDGEIIDQSLAIVRFLAREAGLEGNTSWEKAHADQIVGHFYDVSSSMSMIIT